MIAVVGVFAVMTAPLAVALPATMVLRRYRYILVFVLRFLVFFTFYVGLLIVRLCFMSDIVLIDCIVLIYSAV